MIVTQEEEKHSPVCQLPYNNQGGNSYGVAHDVIIVLEVGLQPGSLSLVISELRWRFQGKDPKGKQDFKSLKRHAILTSSKRKEMAL